MPGSTRYLPDRMINFLEIKLRFLSAPGSGFVREGHACSSECLVWSNTLGVHVVGDVDRESTRRGRGLMGARFPDIISPPCDQCMVMIVCSADGAGRLRAGTPV